MALLKRVLVGCVIALGFGLILWRLWPAPAFVPSVRLPEGVSLAEALRAGKNEPAKGWRTNIYCQRSGRMRFTGRLSGFVEGMRYEIHEALGRTLSRAPNRATCDFVTPRLGECFQSSGEKYLLAREFVWEVDPPQEAGSDFTFLCFIWGGKNQLRHARDTIAVVEDGILKNGIFGMRLKWSLPQQSGVKTTEYLATNRCAVIRDVKGLVKIVPLDYLKAYTDAGLVTLSNKE